jgi:hypothetical protein
MQGRLLPARGGPASHLTIREVVKAAQAKAHRDASAQILRRAVRGLVKQAEGETGAALRSTLASTDPDLALEQAQDVAGTEVEHGTTPGAPGHLVPPDKGLGTSWAPVEADRASTGLHEDQEKQAFIRHILGAGRRGAAALAARGGRAGRVGRFLQRDVRSPIQVARTGKSSASVSARSPLAPAKTPPPIPADAAAKSGPYRTAAQPSAPSAVSKAKEKVKALGKPEGTVKKPKSLTRTLLPGALMLGAGYGVIKGVPAAINWAERAASSPMAYNFGHQQYQYGYQPSGQANF